MEPVFKHGSGNAGDNIECTFHNGVLSINVENPWAGSTETGFGYTCDVSMDARKAREFAQWILAVTEPVT